MPDKSQGGRFFAVNVSGGKTTTYKDGLPVHTYSNAENKVFHQRTLRASNPNLFIGPKLKIERAKRHIQDFEIAVQAFRDTNPYDLIRETDPQTGENVYRMLVKEGVPISLSGFLGDAVHNLRCALDYLICDLIRANGKQPDGNSGFPIKQRTERFKPGRVAKIDRISAKAERLVFRFKGHKSINDALWIIHWLDVIDKHNAIVPVAAANLRVTAKVGVPGMFLGPDGNIRLLGPGPGGVPMLMDAGVPDKFGLVFPLENNIEIYRSPSGF